VKTVFVSSSGTGIGKTLVTAALAWQLRRAGKSVRVLKPVISGYTPETHRDSDTAVLLQSVESRASVATIDAMSPWRFAAPLSPDMAAAREKRSLDLDAITGFCRAAAGGDEDILLIEGVGGVMVPLTGEHTVLDWMAELGAPTLLVVGSYLGTISHTLTAADAVRRRGIEIAGIVISESEESPVPVAETRDTIARFIADAPIRTLPRLPGADPWRIAPALAPALGLL
jgi:dethiobiotin synthetase